MSFIDPYGLFELPVLSQDFADATAGFGDAISSGFGLFDKSLSELARKAINVIALLISAQLHIQAVDMLSTDLG